MAAQAVWRHAAQLGSGGLCEPAGQVERRRHHDSLRAHHAAGARAGMGQGLVHQLHGLCPRLAVVPA